MYIIFKNFSIIIKYYFCLRSFNTKIHPDGDYKDYLRRDNIYYNFFDKKIWKYSQKKFLVSKWIIYY